MVNKIYIYIYINRPANDTGSSDNIRLYVNLPTVYLPSDWISDEINEKAYHFGAKVFHP